MPRLRCDLAFPGSGVDSALLRQHCDFSAEGLLALPFITGMLGAFDKAHQGLVPDTRNPSDSGESGGLKAGEQLN